MMHEQLPDWPPRDTVSDYFGMSKRQWLEVASLYALVAVLFGAIWIERHRSVSKPAVVDPPASFSDRFDHNWITTAPVAPQVLVPPVVSLQESPVLPPPAVVAPNDSASTDTTEEIVPHDPYPPHVASINIQMHRDRPKAHHVRTPKVARRVARRRPHCIRWKPCDMSTIIEQELYR